MRKTENWRAEKRWQQALFGENSEKQRKERVKIKAASNLILQSLFKNLGFTIFHIFIDFFHIPFISFITEK